MRTLVATVLGFLALVPAAHPQALPPIDYSQFDADMRAWAQRVFGVDVARVRLTRRGLVD